MNGLSQDSLLTLLKIAIVPVMLLSILWRNHREKRRRAEATAAATSERKRRRHEVVDLATLGPEPLEALLARRAEGTDLVTPRGQPISDALLRNTLAERLMDAGRFDAADGVLSRGADSDGARMDAGLILNRARLFVHKGRLAEARDALSDAADLQLAALRQAARGIRAHLAEMLAEGMPETDPPRLDDPGLARLGPLPCLHLAGRGEEARVLASELLAVLDRALAAPALDEDGRVDGLPVATLQRIRATLSRVAGWPAA